MIQIPCSFFIPYFYPRPPRGGRRQLGVCPQGAGNFYPRPPRGGRLFRTDELQQLYKFLSTPSARRATVWAADCEKVVIEFLSTPSARRATSSAPAVGGSHLYFYPRPPRGGRPQRSEWQSYPAYFYPRPPRGGRLLKSDDERIDDMLFLSTPSARRATFFGAKREADTEISIHALREEGDAIVRSCASFLPYFYPRPPRGGRHDAP